jgi:hypothetical protein
VALIIGGFDVEITTSPQITSDWTQLDIPDMHQIAYLKKF